MAIILQNAVLVEVDPPAVDTGALRLDGGRVIARGSGVVAEPGDDVIDCDGCVVLPGFVNGHTHLYSALAVGMPPPIRPPRNFPEILREIWWKLDQALDLDTIEIAAQVGALAALRAGTTTLIDHHASPRAIDGSLDRVERGLAAAGVRGVLCYETTDRHGHDGRLAGIAENRRYLAAVESRLPGQFAGLVGAHAAFTLADDALDSLAELAGATGVGVHIHVAEDPCDEADARRRSGCDLARRLADHGILAPGGMIAHGTHLDAAARELLAAHDVVVAHNARSNMNNHVGYARPFAFDNPVVLGTDGIGADMFAEARAAWFIARHAGVSVAPDDVLAMLAAAANRAARSLGVPLGRLAEGSAADVVVTDYRPVTPLTADNLAAHLLFGCNATHVRHVIVDGCWALRDRQPTRVDAMEVARTARPAAERLWHQMAALP